METPFTWLNARFSELMGPRLVSLRHQPFRELLEAQWLALLPRARCCYCAAPGAQLCSPCLEDALGETFCREITPRLDAGRCLMISRYEGRARELILQAKHNRAFNPQPLLQAAAAQATWHFLERGLLMNPDNALNNANHENQAHANSAYWETAHKNSVTDGKLRPQAANVTGIISAGGARVAAPQKNSRNAPKRLYVLPAPSTWRRRLSGRFIALDFAATLANSLQRWQLKRGEWQVSYLDPLRLSLLSGSQRGRGSRSRQRQRKVRLTTHLEGESVLLVDDVLTTGSTIRACLRALEEGGAQVQGIAVLAAAGN